MVEATEASCNSDYEKAEYVHDLIALNCSYDYETYRKSMIIQKGDSLAYSAYGCLVDGEAVCAGYAAAYKLVLNALDIECEVVELNASVILLQKIFNFLFVDEWFVNIEYK